MSRDQEPPATLRDVDPVEPIVAWVGGKRFLAKRIIERIEAIPHSCYAEPCVGMGGVFFRRSKRPRSEVVNDFNGGITNLFRIVREHPEELVRQFDWVLSSRREFKRLLAIPPGTLTDVQRAARFVYLQHLRFGGRPTADSMKFHAQVPTTLKAELLRRIRAAHRRLQSVQIECLPWDAFIRRYDRPFTLFYIDPPYWGFENHYGEGLFAREDFEQLAAVLRRLKGRFILSLNDLPEVRETFAGFELEEVSLRYIANAKAGKQAKELLISDGGF